MIKCISLLVDSSGKAIAKDPSTKENSMSTMGRSIDVSPNGTHIAVGMRDGSLRVYNTSNDQLVYMKKITKSKRNDEWIEDLKFSPDGKHLAVGCHDNYVYLYSVPAFKMLKKFGKSTSFVTHIDWS